MTFKTYLQIPNNFEFVHLIIIILLCCCVLCVTDSCMLAASPGFLQFIQTGIFCLVPDSKYGPNSQLKVKPEY